MTAPKNNISPERSGPQPTVLFVLPALGAGGSERVVTTLANYWARRGRRIGIVTFEAEDTEPFYALYPSIKLTRLNLPPVSSPLWRALQQTSRRIQALKGVFKVQKPDVVISFLTKTNVMALQAAKGLDIPVIISERNNPYTQHFNFLWRRARAHSYPRAYSFVTMTEGAANFYPDRQRPRMQIIANPINLPDQWRNRRGGNILAAVGRLAGQKRFDLLIDAFSKIAADFPDWTLVIWGEGADRKKLEAQRERLGLTDRIRMPGLTPAPGEWVETADVFVLSSDYEGWANVVIEAMAAGLPVVSVDCPFGPGEMITNGENGILTPIGNVQALAAALTDVLGNRRLQEKLGTNAAMAAKKHSTESIAAQWSDLVLEASRK